MMRLVHFFTQNIERAIRSRAASCNISFFLLTLLNQLNYYSESFHNELGLGLSCLAFSFCPLQISISVFVTRVSYTNIGDASS